MIFGLTGKNASGKGEVAKYLITRGFSYFSLSDEIRDEAKKRNIEPTRENLITLGNELREKNGPSALAKIVIKKIKKDSIVDSIRNPAEINELRKITDFVLITVNAPIEIRFQRGVKRGRMGDADTLEKFRELEEKENFKNTIGQQLDKCISMADKVIVNDGSLDELNKKVDKILNDEK